MDGYSCFCGGYCTRSDGQDVLVEGILCLLKLRKGGDGKDGFASKRARDIYTGGERPSLLWGAGKPVLSKTQEQPEARSHGKSAFLWLEKEGPERLGIRKNLPPKP